MSSGGHSAAIRRGGVARSLSVVMLLFAMSLFGLPTAGADACAGWSGPISVNQEGSPAPMAAVSCGSGTFCVGVDVLGDVHEWRDGTWSRAQHVDAGGSLTSVSCTSSTFCVAVSSTRAVIFDGSTWSTSRHLGPADSYRVSCVSSTFCVAVGANGVAGQASAISIFRGRSWRSITYRHDGRASDRLMDVSCASTRYCAAVNLDGSILTYDGHSWSLDSTTAPTGLWTLSCVSAHFCLAVSDHGVSVELDGTHWSRLKQRPDFVDSLTYAVSCSSSKRCVGVGLSGESDEWHDGAWATPVKTFAGAFNAEVDVSCRAGSCLAVTYRGRSSSREVGDGS